MADLIDFFIDVFFASSDACVSGNPPPINKASRAGSFLDFTRLTFFILCPWLMIFSRSSG